MKKFLPIVGLLASFLTAQAQFFPTNLAVLRIGGPGQSLTSSGNTMNIDQYTTAGALVSSVTVPDTGSSALITGAGGSGTEGFISLSADSRYLVLCGYNTNRGSITGSLSGTGSTTNFRGVGIIDGYGAYTLKFAGNVESGNSIRGAVSDGLNNFWVEGGITGIVYVGNNGALATVSSTIANERCLKIFNSNLWFSTGSITHGVWMVPGLPKTGTTVATTLMTNGSSSPEDFVVNTNLGIAYMCDDDPVASGGGICKFTYNGTSWVSNYTIPIGTTAAFAVVADWSGPNPVLYATAGTSSITAANTLVTITDTGASSTSTVIATAPAGQAFRGLSWAPASGASITNAPTALLVDAGQDASFSVGATGTPTLTYQWFSNSVAAPTYVAILGATNATLTLSSTTTGQDGSMVYVVVSNAYGTAQSSPVLLSVQPPGPPINITVTPGALSVLAGAPVVFNSTVVGGVPLTYGWTLNGIPAVDGVNGVTGSHTPSLTIAAAYATNAGSYMVLITNSFNNGASTNAVLTVTDPFISVQPVGATNVLNAPSYTLSVTAGGTPTLTYQWLSNSVAIAGAQASSYSVPSSAVVGQATYSVIVSNGVGTSITSSSAIVAFSPLLLNETFTYANGNLFGAVGSPWTDINGTNPEIVTNGRVVVNQTNATTDAQDLFSQPVNTTVVWASFTINLSTLPTNAGGVYFANFEDTNFGFYGRLFTLTSNKASLTPDMNPIAYPGTYRLGIANAAGDWNGASTNGPAAVVELDLATNTDYRVVEYYDLVNGFCQMAINPSATEAAQMSYVGGATVPNALTSGASFDSFSQSGLPMAAYGLRQRQGEGVFQMDNLLVSFDYGAQYSGFSAVSPGVTTTKGTIGFITSSFTNYSGNSNVIEVAASGIDLTYKWYQNNVALANGGDGGTVTGVTTPALTLNPLAAANTGSYTVVVSNSAGSVTSAIVLVNVNTTTTAPIFTLQPLSATNAEGGTATFTATAVGTGPISYLWSYNGSSLGVTGSILTLPSLNTNQAGTYTVVATGGTSLSTTSSNAILTVTGPLSTNIHYLRSLMSPTTFTPSDTTSLFTVTGTVTVATNLTSGNTSSYYLQDSTGGINLFITGDSNFRPAQGDVVTATGVLSAFGNNLELDITSGAAYQTYSDLGAFGTNYAPILLPWGYVAANPGPTVTNIEGSIVVMTNVYFTTSGVFTNGTTTYNITNKTGQAFSVFVSAQDTNFNGQPIPAFAYSVTGVLYQNGTNYQVIVSTYSDIQIAPPAPVNVAASASGVGGTNITLTWQAVPYKDTYSILTSTNVAGPYTTLASGLWFTTTNGVYIDVGPTNMTKFYDIVSP